MIYLVRWLRVFGVDLKIMTRALSGFVEYIRDLKLIKKSISESGVNEFKFKANYPCVHDRYDSAGVIGGHYFLQDLCVARKIFNINPVNHLDVGSRIDGFVAHVACYRSLDVADVREFPQSVPGISFKQMDLMGVLDGSLIGTYVSVSCLHALEHFGLGRYGDSIDCNGHILGLDNLWLLLADGGLLYLSVPIGEQRIEFNAHRVFDISYLVKLYDKKFEVKSFSYVDDAGLLHSDVSFSPSLIASNFGCHYGCGIFELQKIADLANVKL